MFRFNSLRLTTAQRKILICLALAALTLAAYWPSLKLGFINLDDSLYVTGNPRVKAGLSWDNVRWAFTSLSAANWHPLTWLSYMLDVQCWGVNAKAMHAVNLALHILNTTVLFLCLQSMTGAMWRSAFASAVFAVHPLHVESVVWIAERKDVLSALFGLLAIWAYSGWRQRPSPGRYAIVVMMFAFSLMSKPMLVTLPCLLLLLDLWPLKHSVSIGRLIMAKIPLLAMAAGSCAITLYAQHAGQAMEALGSLTLAQRAANAMVAYGDYLLKTIWPVTLAIVYPHPGDWPIRRVIIAVVVVIGVSAISMALRRRQPHLLIGWLWFLGSLAPVIGLVQVGQQSMADRYMYVPMIGLIIMVAWTIPAWTQTRAERAGVVALAATVIAALAWRTMDQIRHWSDSITLFEHASRVVKDNDLAHNQLAELLARRGDWNAASEHAASALRINPTATASHDYFGGILIETGQFDEAVAYFQEVIRAAPDSPQAHNNLGIALMRLGQLDEAIQHYHRALMLHPEYVSVHINLAQALSRQRNSLDAITHYQLALRLDPGRAIAHANLGLLLWQQQKPGEAIAHLREAVALNPDMAEARANLGILLSSMGRIDEGRAHLRVAARLKPDDPVILEQLRRVEQATPGVAP